MPCHFDGRKVIDGMEVGVDTVDRVGDYRIFFMFSGVGTLAMDSGLEGTIFRLFGGEFCDSHRFGMLRAGWFLLTRMAFLTRPFNSASVLVMLVKE